MCCLVVWFGAGCGAIWGWMLPPSPTATVNWQISQPLMETRRLIVLRCWSFWCEPQCVTLLCSKVGLIHCRWLKMLACLAGLKSEWMWGQIRLRSNSCGKDSKDLLFLLKSSKQISWPHLDGWVSDKLSIMQQYRTLNGCSNLHSFVHSSVICVY